MARQPSFYAFTLLCLFQVATAIYDSCTVPQGTQFQNLTLNSSCWIDPLEFHENGTAKARDRVTLECCRTECGTGWKLYPALDILRRIALWKIPLFLLIGNLQLAPIGKTNSICAVVHMLGDPIDTLLSLLMKLEVSRRLYVQWSTAFCPSPTDIGVTDSERANTDSDSGISLTPSESRDLATVTAVYDDCNWTSETAFLEIRSKLKTLSTSQREIFLAASSEAAHKLAEARVDDRLRAWLAVIGYIAAVIAAFFKTLEEGPSNRTAHTIAFAILYTWLVPIVLLSVSIGGFTSNRSVPRVLRELKDEFGPDWPMPELGDWECASTIRNPFTATDLVRWVQPLDHARPYAGINYSYRPNKRLAPSNPPRHLRHSYVLDRSLPRLYLTAAFPVVLAAFCAMVLSCLTPTEGFGCRSMTQGGFLVAWILSAFLTNISGHFFTGLFHWYFTIAKDAALTALTFGFLIAAFVGRYNSCYCWSATFSLLNKAYYQWATADRLGVLVKTRWPVVVTIGLLGQALVWVFIRLGDGKGIGLLRREEEELEKQFEDLQRQERVITRRPSSIPEGLPVMRRRRGGDY